MVFDNMLVNATPHNALLNTIWTGNTDGFGKIVGSESKTSADIVTAKIPWLLAISRSRTSHIVEVMIALQLSPGRTTIVSRM